MPHGLATWRNARSLLQSAAQVWQDLTREYIWQAANGEYQTVWNFSPQIGQHMARFGQI